MPSPENMDTSNGNIGSKPASPRVPVKAVSIQRTVEEMRQHIAKLKAELDAEKARNKQIHRDKVTEIRNVKEAFEKDREHRFHSTQLKYEHEKQAELNRLREEIKKEKDYEIRQLLRENEETIKQLKTQFAEEKDEAVQTALDLHRKSADPFGSGSGNSALVVKLQREIKSLKESKKDLEGQLDAKRQSEDEKSVEIKKLKRDYEEKIQSLSESIETLHQSRSVGLKSVDVTAVRNELEKISMDSMGHMTDITQGESGISQLALFTTGGAGRPF